MGRRGNIATHRYHHCRYNDHELIAADLEEARVEELRRLLDNGGAVDGLLHRKARHGEHSEPTVLDLSLTSKSWNGRGLSGNTHMGPSWVCPLHS